ncbi:MAG: hypothetical protein CMJ25_27625 [Phycisphaerae bacterium]|nr:hypothetical protein [Phycisphaerae bacterium]
MSDRSHPTGWTHRQRQCVIMACSAAGWNAQQRYMVMLHCGCPLDPKTQRPSIKHPRNTSEQMGLIMSFAEPVARDRGKPLRPPKAHRSWESAVADKAQRQRHKAREIIDEAVAEIPSKFNSGLERYVVEHVYDCDQGKSGAGFMEHQPESIEQCDAPTVYRVIECLRAFVGREFAARGIEPRSFTIPRTARQRARRAS